GKRSFDRSMARRADRTPDPVQEAPLRLAVHAVIPAARRMRGDEIGEDARDRGRVELDRDVGVVGHHSPIWMPRSFASFDHFAIASAMYSHELSALTRR